MTEYDNFSVECEVVNGDEVTRYVRVLMYLERICPSSMGMTRWPTWVVSCDNLMVERFEGDLRMSAAINDEPVLISWTVES